jgi:hypothetical protein
MCPLEICPSRQANQRLQLRDIVGAQWKPTKTKTSGAPTKEVQQPTYNKYIISYNYNYNIDPNIVSSC